MTGISALMFNLKVSVLVYCVSFRLSVAINVLRSPDLLDANLEFSALSLPEKGENNNNSSICCV